VTWGDVLTMCRPQGTYVGEWVEDKKEGFGKQVWEHGAKYEGEFLAGKRHGRGTLWVLEGPKLRKRYSGDWVSGKRQGLGVAIGNGKTADIYEGEWYMNKRHGRGKMRYANGDVYEGEWHGGVRSGFGVLQKANGDRFEGQWLDGRKEGPGCYIFQDTNKVLEGEWTDDIAKTGEYRALEVRETRRHGLSSPLDFTLPVLTVADPDLILEEAAAGERQLRKGRRRAGDFTDASDVWADCGRRTPVFTRRQIAKLREHFESFVARSADKEGNRGRQIQLNLLPEMLGGLGQEISENEFSMLMHHIVSSGPRCRILRKVDPRLTELMSRHRERIRRASSVSRILWTSSRLSSSNQVIFNASLSSSGKRGQASCFCPQRIAVTALSCRSEAQRLSWVHM